MVSIGDKLVVTKGLRGWLDEGEVVTVTNVDNGIIYFAFGENFEHKGLMNFAECERCFEKIEIEEEKKILPIISWEDIEEIINESDISFDAVFDKCIVGTCRLPNGFVIVESHSWANEEDFNEDEGIEVCLGKFEDKIKELETYRLMSECFDCFGCCVEDVIEEEFEDCEHCDEFDCEFNPNSLKH